MNQGLSMLSLINISFNDIPDSFADIIADTGNLFYDIPGSVDIINYLLISAIH